MALIEGRADDYSTFIRSSGGSRFNAQKQSEWMASNLRRDDFDPVTGSAKGVLIEPQRTRLSTRSSDFANWTKNALTVDVPTEGLFGPASMHKVNMTGGVRATTRLYRHVSTLLGDTQTMMVVYKPGAGVPFIRIGPEAGQGGATFSVADGSIVSGASGAAFSRRLTSELILIGVSGTAVTNDSVDNQFVAFSDQSGANGFAAAPVGTEHIFIGRVETQSGLGEGSFILGDENVQVTRAADQLSYPLPTGIHDIRYTLDDNSTFDVLNATGTQTIPTNLPRRHVKSLKWKLKQ